VSDPVRIVVAEGPSSRKGLLRFVLDGEGYDVVGEATTSAQLARTVTIHRPDVVVMDDGIGSMAVGMIREIVPSARVVLIWPGAVVPIGGDARVEPSEVLRELGRTIERLTGQKGATSIDEALETPDRADRIRADPATLREILARGEAAQLQRTHPSRAGAIAAFSGEAIIEDRPAPVVTLPVIPALHEPDDAVVVPEASPGDAETVMVPEADGDGTAALDTAPGDPDPEANELNGKLGTITLGGAAAAGALVLALAREGSRVPVSEVRGEAPIVDEGDATVSIDPVDPSYPPDPAPGLTSAGGKGPDGSSGSGGSGSGGSGSGGSGSGGSGSGGSGSGGSGSGGSGSGTGSGGGAGGGGSVEGGLPGQCAAHNPHGGPPGQTGVFPGQGDGGDHQGPGTGHGGDHSRGSGNANGHGAHATTHRHDHKR